MESSWSKCRHGGSQFWIIFGFPTHLAKTCPWSDCCSEIPAGMYSTRLWPKTDSATWILPDELWLSQGRSVHHMNMLFPQVIENKHMLKGHSGQNQERNTPYNCYKHTNLLESYSSDTLVSRAIFSGLNTLCFHLLYDWPVILTRQHYMTNDWLLVVSICTCCMTCVLYWSVQIINVLYVKATTQKCKSCQKLRRNLEMHLTICDCALSNTTWQNNNSFKS